MGSKKKLVDDALALVSKHIAPGTDEWAANLDRFYDGTHPNYRQKYYTGTSKDKDFTSFQESRHGTWLTNDPKSASDYAMSNDSQNLRPVPGTWSYEKVNSASRVIPAYARVKNPYTGDKPDWVMGKENYKKAQSDWFDLLRAQGYDAWAPDSQKGDLLVILTDQGRGVKSALGNCGTFDPNEKHMGKAGGGLVDDALRLAGKLVDGDTVDEVPSFLREGYKVEAHPTATGEAKSLVDYLNASRSHLPMDEAARTGRAADMGYEYDAYHGAPRDIEGFANHFSNPGGYWGGHHYATTSPVDASSNYATPLGADIAQRIGEVQSQLLDEFHPDDVKGWFKNTYNRDLTDEEAVMSKNVDEWSQSIAQDQLGITNSGTVYPVKMRMQNPVRIEGPDQTFWPADINYTEDGDIAEEVGPAFDLMQSLRDTLDDYGGPPPDDTVNEVAQHVYENGGIDPKTLRDIVMKTDGYYHDVDGNMVSSGHILSDVFQRMGHDGIIMDTEVFAPNRFRRGMAGTGGDTQHYIVFDPKNIRSRFGAFDPEKADSTRLSDANGGRVEKGGGGALVDEALKLIRAYHVSPHDFDKFEWSPRVRGTGEGNQAYGDGLYFAESPKVSGRGGEYWDRFAQDREIKLGPWDTIAAFAMKQTNWDRDAAVARLKAQEEAYRLRAAEYANGGSGESVVARHLRYADDSRLAADLLKAGHHVGPHTYEVDIKADPSSMLDWDVPLAEQPVFNRIMEREAAKPVPPELEIIAKRSGADPRERQRELVGKMTGGDFWHSEAGNYGGGENARSRLMDIGIPAIRYWDGNSRNRAYIGEWRSKDGGVARMTFPSESAAKDAAGRRGDGWDLQQVIKNPEATSNYVVFDDKIIDIKNKYAEGGEVERDGYATRGRVGAALKIAREGLEKLAKDRGMPPEALGRQFSKVLPGTPFEEWRYEFQPTAELLPQKKFDPANLNEGDVLIPLVGDRTSNARKITSIAGNKLSRPVITEGGPDYMRGPAQMRDGSAWASGETVVPKLTGNINRALEVSRRAGHKDPSAYGVYVAMGHDAGDFSAHTAEAVMGMLPHAKILQKDAEAFDAKIKAVDPKWPGILSRKVRNYVVNADAGQHRKVVLKEMDKADWIKKGFPDVSLARYATMTPDLVPTPDEAAGYAVAKMSPLPRAGSISVPHRTYPLTMPGEYVGRLPDGLSRDDLFTTFSNAYDQRPPSGNAVMAKRRSFTMSPDAFQVLTGNDIEEIIAKSLRMTDNYADGGEVNEDIDSAVRIAKDKGGALRKATMKLLGKSEREGLQSLTEPGSGYLSVPGKPSIVKLPGIGEAEAKPLTRVMDTADAYMAKRGLPGGHEAEGFPVLDEEFSRRLADAYERMKHAPDDPEVRRSFEAMAQETLDQLEAAKEAGIDFRAIRGADPYAASPSIGYADVAERGTLHFFPTDAGFGSSSDFDPSKNPLLKRIGKVGDLENATVNDAFRIVHDLYGHYGPGNPFFRAPGEERAYLMHRRMYSPDALPAMTSETRGQNSWLNYGPHGDKNRKAVSEDTTFADQKTGLMEPWTYLERADGGAVDAAMRIAKEVGGGTSPVFITDAQGRQYDAKGNIVPPSNGTTQQSSSAAVDTPSATDERPGRVDIGEPENYESEVKPFIDAAMTPQNFAQRDPNSFVGTQQAEDPSLLEAMKIATKLAASGQPTDERGAQNWARRREETVRSVMGAPVDGTSSPNMGPMTYNPSGMADYVNTLIDFSPWALGEIAHDIPYQAGVTGDYGTAAVEGGLNAALSAPGIAALGAIGRAGVNMVRKSPKIAAGLAGAAVAGAPSDAEAGPARWYSKLLEVAQAIPMEKMTGEQALAMLRKGVSPEELRWTGTEKMLSGMPRISKGELVDHIAKNRFQLNEVTLGGGRPGSLKEVMWQDIPQPIKDKYAAKLNEAFEAQLNAKARLRALKDQGRGREMGDQEYISALQAVEDANNAVDAVGNEARQEYVDSIGGLGRSTKYHNYSTPGGEGYRETLYTMGNEKPVKVGQNAAGQWIVTEADGTPIRDWMGRVRTYYDKWDAEEGVRNIHSQRGLYKSPHWDDPNVLFHTRGQTLTYDPPGANRPYRVHNVDENQSDPGQSGRKIGFYDPAKVTEAQGYLAQRDEIEKVWRQKANEIDNARMAENKPIRDAEDAESVALREAVRRGDINMRQYNEAIALLGEKYWKIREPTQAKYRALQDEVLAPLRKQMDDLQRKYNETMPTNKGRGIPSMPFVTSTEGWTDRAIKQELDKALDSGSDYFSWTPGKVHADRYNLRNHVDSIVYNPVSGHFTAISASDGSPVVDRIIKDPNELDDLIGKEVADRLRSGAEADLQNIRNQYKIVDSPTPGTFYIKQPDGAMVKYGDNPYDSEPVPFYSYEDAQGHINDQIANGYAEGFFSPFRLTGQGLEMGGEGMIGYYDTVYLKRVQKVLEKATGMKIPLEEIEVQTGSGPRKQLGIRLTDEIREKARFSDFARGGTVTGRQIRDTSPAVSRALAITSEY